MQEDVLNQKTKEVIQLKKNVLFSLKMVLKNKSFGMI